MRVNKPGVAMTGPITTNERSPLEASVLELIDQAQEHPLGTDFLVHGCLESVAATFGVHAFVVDKARESFPPPPPLDIGLVPGEDEGR